MDSGHSTASGIGPWKEYTGKLEGVGGHLALQSSGFSGVCYITFNNLHVQYIIQCLIVVKYAEHKISFFFLN